jgi:hypothetical protein
MTTTATGVVGAIGCGCGETERTSTCPAPATVAGSLGGAEDGAVLSAAGAVA